MRSLKSLFPFHILLLLALIPFIIGGCNGGSGGGDGGAGSGGSTDGGGGSGTGNSEYCFNDDDPNTEGVQIILTDVPADQSSVISVPVTLVANQNADPSYNCEYFEVKSYDIQSTNINLSLDYDPQYQGEPVWQIFTGSDVTGAYLDQNFFTRIVNNTGTTLAEGTYTVTTTFHLELEGGQSQFPAGYEYRLPVESILPVTAAAGPGTGGGGGTGGPPGPGTGTGPTTHSCAEGFGVSITASSGTLAGYTVTVPMDSTATGYIDFDPSLTTNLCPIPFDWRADVRCYSEELNATLVCDNLTVNLATTSGTVTDSQAPTILTQWDATWVYVQAIQIWLVDIYDTKNTPSILDDELMFSIPFGGELPSGIRLPEMVETTGDIGTQAPSIPNLLDSQ